MYETDLRQRCYFNISFGKGNLPPAGEKSEYRSKNIFAFRLKKKKFNKKKNLTKKKPLKSSNHFSSMEKF